MVETESVGNIEHANWCVSINPAFFFFFFTELYYLIVKFLDAGPLRETADVSFPIIT